ncbi:gliding motility-associated protein GldM [Mucilaginibacter gossypiicola]|uniref:Gliding motility-associated protein GldM n=1 Tax=Mucilaginibacter gossypiicola TaxID=551995 RepID=A0A1H8PXE9_9SPHI|nr:gliding motility protein GldM [Mucilaginibacter gossypiicola]SEO46659.1 gliding motility-associated protein GldM [Mucilaginibacter gossypiicola]
MAGGKETPRQRMIGILYLVLLGLIALNVPDSLLDAFKNITNSLDASTKNVNTGLQATYSAFENTKLKEQKERAQPIYDKAKDASKIAAELNTYVEQLKAKLIEEGGGINPEIDDVNARDNLDISPRIMINQKNGEKLKAKIDETRQRLLEALGKDSVGVQFSLNTIAPKTHGDVKKSWQEANFGDGIPLGAALTTLAKIEADNKNAENEVVKKLLGKIDQAQVTLDKFSAVVVAPSSYVIAGQPYTAQIFLTAYDSKSNPDITVNGSRVSVTDGKGNYTVTASGEGKHSVEGFITVKNNTTGKNDSYPFKQEYTVARPSAVISPDKMNVLYIGVPNPISVSAPGVAAGDLNVHFSGAGSLSGSGGHYTATVSSIGRATISVSGAKGAVLGSTEFRIKRIPDPKPQFAGKSGGNTSSANIKAQDRLFAQLDNFDFDAKFNVTHFTMLVVKPRQDAIILSGSGGDLTSAMHSALNTVTPGTTVIFKDIIAVGPDHSPRSLDPIVLSAN